MKGNVMREDLKEFIRICIRAKHLFYLIILLTVIITATIVVCNICKTIQSKHTSEQALLKEKLSFQKESEAKLFATYERILNCKINKEQEKAKLEASSHLKPPTNVNTKNNIK